MSFNPKPRIPDVTSPKWLFRKMGRGEVAIDPVEGEFFSTNTLDTLADALVREAIQNILDAKKNSYEGPVRARFFFSGDTHALDKDKAQNFLAGLRPHLEAKSNGLSGLPLPSDKMDFISIEDFGTKGLRGSPEQFSDLEGNTESERNDFFYFWRNVGRSSKSETDRGRWGLGKTVFPASSRINSFFGATVREDHSRLLMGQSVLKVHQLNGERTYPYGYYGVFNEESDYFAMPVADEKQIAHFSEQFRLERQGESGLSIVIPYPEKEINPQRIARSIIKHYFYPILAEELVAEIVHEERTLILDSNNIDGVLKNIDWTQTGYSAERLTNLLNFSRWAIALPPENHVMLTEQNPDSAPQWSEKLFDAESLTSLRELFEKGERIAIRVPVKVQKKGQQAQTSYFNVYLERDSGLDRAEDHYIREGITIAGVTSLRDSGLRGLVVVSEKALTTLLGDSENPAHTQWEERSQKFKQKYEHGASCLRFVKNSLREIVKFISRPAEGRDTTLLRHLFFVNRPPEDRPEDSPDVTNRKGNQQPPVPPVIPTKRVSQFQIRRIDGGFNVTGNTEAESLPDLIHVEVAYEVRRGNPFQAYHPLDFSMKKPPVKIEAVGAVISSSELNRLDFFPEAKDFQVIVTGFDPLRDLRIKAVSRVRKKEE